MLVFCRVVMFFIIIIISSYVYSCYYYACLRDSSSFLVLRYSFFRHISYLFIVRSSVVARTSSFLCVVFVFVFLLRTSCFFFMICSCSCVFYYAYSLLIFVVLLYLLFFLRVMCLLSYCVCPLCSFVCLLSSLFLSSACCRREALPTRPVVGGRPSGYVGEG